MNQEPHSFSSQKIQAQIQVNLDEFNIDEDSFKPMTKGLGFHHDQKRPSFNSTPKEVKVFGSAKTQPKAASLLNPLTAKTTSQIAQHVPTGLEAFYGTRGDSAPKSLTAKLEEKAEHFNIEKKEIKNHHQAASSILQFSAWIIDLLVVASFVVVTGALLVLASGIQFQMFIKLISMQDLILFSSAIFSIYYLLYFTILDLTASPGKTILGLRLLKSDEGHVTVKNTFIRSLVSLLSVVVLFLPLLLDFQGRLSDTKLVK